MAGKLLGTWENARKMLETSDSRTDLTVDDFIYKQLGMMRLGGGWMELVKWSCWDMLQETTIFYSQFLMGINGKTFEEIDQLFDETTATECQSPAEMVGPKAP